MYAHTCYYCSTDTDEDAYQNYASSNTTDNDPRWHSRLSCRRREREREMSICTYNTICHSIDATPLNWCKNFSIRWTKERTKCSSIVDPQTVIVGSYWLTLTQLLYDNTHHARVQSRSTQCPALRGEEYCNIEPASHTRLFEGRSGLVKCRTSTLWGQQRRQTYDNCFLHW